MESRSKLDVIQSRLEAPLADMNGVISESMHTGNELLNRVVTDYLRIKGKQIRPIMVLLSAQMFGGINRHVIYAAAALEMLHNASLIHDDVVDETRQRRGQSTVNASWGNHIAVLTGDFFVSKALEVGLRTGSVTVLRGLSELGVELSTGEVDQICNARSHHFLEEEYMSMIRKKTASLFTRCILLGADTSFSKKARKERGPESGSERGSESASEGQTDGAEVDLKPILRFAELLGLCFQIKDDIFDYYPSTGAIGKPTGNDLREGKVTLPLIYALRTAPKAEADAMREILLSHIPSQPEIDRLVEFARNHGGIDYAFGVMERMRREAMEMLDVYPDSPARRSFADIFDFIINRNY